ESWHHSADCRDPGAHRRRAHLAALSQLGVRSQWNRRCRTVNRDRTVLDGTVVIPRGDGEVFHSREKTSLASWQRLQAYCSWRRPWAAPRHVPRKGPVNNAVEVARTVGDVKSVKNDMRLK